MDGGTAEKLIRIRFTSLASTEEQRIRKFINDAVVKKDAQVNDSMLGGALMRNDVRIDIDRVIQLESEATKTLPAQSFKARTSDLSTGGMCVRVAQDQKLIKNSKIKIFLYFIDRDFVVSGEILGLKA
jgi:hypothetical protein